MVNAGIEGVDFICANTDAQALKSARVERRCRSAAISRRVSAPVPTRISAARRRWKIVTAFMEVIEGADMLFITAGMGGGTGTGAAPVVAQVAKELGILTVAVVTKPFLMEGGKRMQIADDGIGELGKYVDSLITIPNEKLLTVLGGETTLLDAFRSANEVLQGAVQGIAELITRPGLINVDFADVRTVMAEMGMAMMGSGVSHGEDRAREAAEAAVSSPLLEDINLAGANGILVNVTAGMDLSIGEFQEVGNTVKEFASDDATVVVGTVIDPDMTDQDSRNGRCDRSRQACRKRRVADAYRASDRARRPNRTTTRWTSRRCSANAPLATVLRQADCRKNCWIFRRSCDARLTDEEGMRPAVLLTHRRERSSALPAR